MDKAMLKICDIISEQSKCKRAKVGSVITKHGRIISTGYNGPYYGKNCKVCKAGCDNSIHAEENAILYAAKTGIDLENATLYTTYSPCIKCAQKIAMVGIVQVFYKIHYRDESGLDFLNSVGVLTHHHII